MLRWTNQPQRHLNIFALITPITSLYKNRKQANKSHENILIFPAATNFLYIWNKVKKWKKFFFFFFWVKELYWRKRMMYIDCLQLPRKTFDVLFSFTWKDRSLTSLASSLFRLSIFLKVSCGFNTERQGGNTITHFTLYAWTEYQMCTDPSPVDFERNALPGHW